MATKDSNDRQVLFTPKFRAAYANVFKPRANENGKEKYGVCMMFPKKDPKVREWLKGLKVQCEKLAKTHYPNGPIPKNVRVWPLRDGDTERDGEEFKGMYFLNSTSGRRPGVVDKDLNPIMDPEEFYSGCYAIATINLFWYENSGNKGVSIGLNNLKKMADGEPLSGGAASAERDFADYDDGENDVGGSDDDDLL